MTTLAIMTCPGRDYLRGTLRALEGQPWAGRRLIWSDGPCDMRPSGWEVIERERTGPPNVWPFLGLLCEAQGDDLLLLQDDVTASPGALAYIERMGVPPGCAFVSWFDPICRRATIGVPFTATVPASKVLPAQARTYPRATIDRLVDGAADGVIGGGDDDFVASAVGDLPAVVHVPSLFRHDGAVSSVGSSMANPMLRSESWLGAGYDVARGFAHVQPSDLWGGA